MRDLTAASSTLRSSPAFCAGADDEHPPSAGDTGISLWLSTRADRAVNARSQPGNVYYILLASPLRVRWG